MRFARLVLLAFIAVCHAAAAAAGGQGGIAELIDEAKQAVVFLGHTEKKPDGSVTNVFEATGCLIKVDGYFHLLTAKHVATRRGKEFVGDLLVFLNSRQGGVSSRAVADIRKQFEVDWIPHPNEEVDLAVLPIPLSPETDHVKVVPQELFQQPDKIYELYDVFFLSYQPGVGHTDHIEPIVRRATVSLINSDGTLLVDGNAFPGNSGSPVFLTPSAIRFDGGGISLGGDPLGGRFIGIIGAYIPYQEIAISAQTGRPRVMFEENTGLSVVSSVSLVKELVESSAARTQIERLRKRYPEKNSP